MKLYKTGGNGKHIERNFSKTSPTSDGIKEVSLSMEPRMVGDNNCPQFDKVINKIHTNTYHCIITY